MKKLFKFFCIIFFATSYSVAVSSESDNNEYFCIRSPSGEYVTPQERRPFDHFTGGIVLDSVDHINCWQNDKYLYRFENGLARNKLAGYSLVYEMSMGVYYDRFSFRAYYNSNYNSSAIFSPVFQDPTSFFVHNIYGDTMVNVVVNGGAYSYLLSTKNQTRATRWQLIYSKETNPDPTCNLSTDEYFCLREESSGQFLRYTNLTSSEGGGLALDPSDAERCVQDDLFQFHMIRTSDGQTHIYNKVSNLKLSYIDDNYVGSSFYFSDDVPYGSNTSARLVESSANSNLYYIYSHYRQMMTDQSEGGTFSRMLSTVMPEEAGRFKLVCTGKSPPEPPQPGCDLTTNASFCIRDSKSGKFLRYDGKIGEGGIRGLEFAPATADTCFQDDSFLFNLDGQMMNNIETSMKITHKKYYSYPDNAYKFGFALHSQPTDTDSFAEIRSVGVNNPYQFHISPISDPYDRIKMSTDFVSNMTGVGGFADTQDTALYGYFEIRCKETVVTTTTPASTVTVPLTTKWNTDATTDRTSSFDPITTDLTQPTGQPSTEKNIPSYAEHTSSFITKIGLLCYTLVIVVNLN